MRYGLVAALAFWFSDLTLAFDARGHATVCQMAYDQLSVKAQQHVDALVQKSPEKHFATACAWPDRVRDQKAYSHTKPWHYVNVPRDAIAVKPSDCPADGCLLSAISEMFYRLKDNPTSDWGALLFLSHFMADLHQPMHVSYFDDRGGNRTSVRLDGQKTNLHHIWDGDLLGRYPWRSASAHLLADMSVENRQLWRAGDLYQWANESLMLTREIYASLPPHGTLDKSYSQQHIPALQLQMQKASVRLAYMLEKAFGL